MRTYPSDRTVAGPLGCGGKLTRRPVQQGGRPFSIRPEAPQLRIGSERDRVDEVGQLFGPMALALIPLAIDACHSAVARRDERDFALSRAWCALRPANFSSCGANHSQVSAAGRIAQEGLPRSVSTCAACQILAAVNSLDRRRTVRWRSVGFVDLRQALESVYAAGSGKDASARQQGAW